MRIVTIPVAFAALTGCGVNFDLSTSGDFAVELGKFNEQCLLPPTPYPLAGNGLCEVTHEPLDGETCRITTLCSGLSLIDTDEIRQEIDDAVGSAADRVNARIRTLDLLVTEVSLDTDRPQIESFDLSFDSAKAADLNIFTMDENDLIAIDAGESILVYSGEDDDAFLTQINTCVDEGTKLPIELALVLEVPLSEVADKLVGQEVEAKVAYEVDALGRGSLCVLGCK